MLIFPLFGGYMLASVSFIPLKSSLESRTWIPIVSINFTFSLQSQHGSLSFQPSLPATLLSSLNRHTSSHYPSDITMIPSFLSLLFRLPCYHPYIIIDIITIFPQISAWCPLFFALSFANLAILFISSWIIIVIIFLTIYIIRKTKYYISCYSFFIMRIDVDMDQIEFEKDDEGYICNTAPRVST